VDEHERRLQEAVLSGPRRSRGALAEQVQADRELPLELDSSRPAGRIRTGAYAGWLQHCSLVLAELRPGEESDLLAQILLVPPSADMAEHLAADANGSLSDLVGPLSTLVDRLAG